MNEFPKAVWYTFGENHKDATIISDEDKARVRKDALGEVFWEDE